MIFYPVPPPARAESSKAAALRSNQTKQEPLPSPLPPKRDPAIPLVHAEALKVEVKSMVSSALSERALLEEAFRDFMEYKLDDKIMERTQALKERLVHQSDELRWTTLRLEEENKRLESNQIMMLSVIDKLQVELRELRYDLGHATPYPFDEQEYVQFDSF